MAILENSNLASLFTAVLMPNTAAKPVQQPSVGLRSLHS